MKNLRPVFFSLLVMSAAAASASPEKPFSVGVFAGDSTTTINAYYKDTYDNPFDKEFEYNINKSSAETLSVTGGWRFVDNWGVELQLSSGLDSDTVFREMNPEDRSSTSMRLSSNAFGAYMFYKAGEKAYFKVRLGLGMTSLKFETDNDSASYSKFSYSYGVAVGMQAGGIGAFEIMYMRYPDVSIDKQDFRETFALACGSQDPSTAGCVPGGQDSVLDLARHVKHEVFSFGYTFQF